jgi:hypothetical protein
MLYIVIGIVCFAAGTFFASIPADSPEERAAQQGRIYGEDGRFRE